MSTARHAPCLTSADHGVQPLTSAPRLADRRLAELLDETTSARLAAAGQLAAGLMHEVNNPLAVVLGNLEFARLALRDFLARQPAAAVASELELLSQLIGDAEFGAQRIVDVVSDLRPLSRSGDPLPSTFEVASAVRSALRVARARVQLVAELELELEPGLVVVGNAGQLTQAVLALLLDAAEVLRADGTEQAKLFLRVTRERGQVVLTISDSGPRIPDALLPRLFEPLAVRAPGARGGVAPCVVRDIVERLGGTVEVSSGERSGVTFTLRLPLVAADQGAGAGEAAA
jgi:two-component system NtrC family sensor kinase